MSSTALTFTVAEVAAKVARSPELIDLVIRRIRHWTLVGALQPVDDPHSGSGHHRRYLPRTFYTAAVLNALADMGLPVAVFDLVTKNLLARGRDEKQMELWRRAVEGKVQIFLAVFVFHAPTGFVREGGDAWLLESDQLQGQITAHEELIVINLTKLFRRVQP